MLLRILNCWTWWWRGPFARMVVKAPLPLPLFQIGQLNHPWAFKRASTVTQWNYVVKCSKLCLLPYETIALKSILSYIMRQLLITERNKKQSRIRLTGVKSRGKTGRGGRKDWPRYRTFQAKSFLESAQHKWQLLWCRERPWAAASRALHRE